MKAFLSILFISLLYNLTSTLELKREIDVTTTPSTPSSNSTTMPPAIKATPHPTEIIGVPNKMTPTTTPLSTTTHKTEINILRTPPTTTTTTTTTVQRQTQPGQTTISGTMIPSNIPAVDPRIEPLSDPRIAPPADPRIAELSDPRIALPAGPRIAPLAALMAMMTPPPTQIPLPTPRNFGKPKLMNQTMQGNIPKQHTMMQPPVIPSRKPIMFHKTTPENHTSPTQATPDHKPSREELMETDGSIVEESSEHQMQAMDDM
jgi:hypothetical protein